MDRIQAMRLFAAVAEHGGFTQAARREGVSPGQVSKKIAALESHLGARLLDRTTRSVSLTPAGAAYLEGVRSLLADLDTLEDGVRAEHAEPAGALRIAAPLTFGALRLMPVILSFLKAHPQVEARLSLSDRMVDLVEEGFDVAVRIGKLEDSSLIARRLSPANVALVVKPGHPAEAVAAPADLENHVCVIDTNMPTPHRWTFEKDGQVEEVRVNGGLHVNSAEAARIAAVEGYGVALAPTFIVADDVAAGRLTRLLCDWTPDHRDIWAVFPQNRYLSARVRLFIDHLADSFGPEPDWDRGL